MSSFYNPINSWCLSTLFPIYHPVSLCEMSDCTSSMSCKCYFVFWCYQIELVLGDFKKTHWSQTVIWHTKERSAGYNYETIVCWQTDWQANWLFQYCKNKKVQCEELAVTQGLRCVAVLGCSERRTNVHILPAKTKNEKTRQFNFLSRCNSQTYTTNKTNYMYIHDVF